ncbi:hypothetical protein HYDPIDRAFT_169087 [Hydnomerulius pinastri MD-312]|uniref:Unplaced genomic scaffold scaffold_21, whole genome shotgun sequence n=1 Tax=Hydnomerulius pinastri MD-312 TaxID=994086 RepID=A0A0C9W688_9AGAM|nr:hypothetical protein HYDPIDRAFT_169087 [Hydnomerulius pinastri MD-312]
MADNGNSDPGIQLPTTHQAVAPDFAVSEETWQNLIKGGSTDFDFIVIGSGFTALAFIKETLKRNPDRKILCLERGDFWTLDHYQNLILPSKYTFGDSSETPPPTLTDANNNNLKFGPSQTLFFGGRSVLWSAWCPAPDISLLRGWPNWLKEKAAQPGFFTRAKKLLGVKESTQLGSPYEALQRQINTRLRDAFFWTAHAVYPAPLAVGPGKHSAIRYSNFSTPGPLLSLYETQQQRIKDGVDASLLFATGVAVEYLGVDVEHPNLSQDVSVELLRTSRGDLPIDPARTKVILCAGTFPNNTLLLKSFSGNPHVAEFAGKPRVTGHILSQTVGRVKRTEFSGLKANSIEIGAEYLEGQHPRTKSQYHIQITAITSPDPHQDAEDAARFFPDYAAAATAEQFDGSEDYVIFACITLGEVTARNSLGQPLSGDPASKTQLQLPLRDDDKELWDLMDSATFRAINKMTGGGPVEWWWKPKGSQLPSEWRLDQRPGPETIRLEGIIIHEASLYSVVDDEGANGCIDTNFNVKGVKNVFVTGAGIFPAVGSWNPTLTICAFAQDLARNLTPHVHTNNIFSDDESGRDSQDENSSLGDVIGARTDDDDTPYFDEPFEDFSEIEDLNKEYNEARKQYASDASKLQQLSDGFKETKKIMWSKWQERLQTST